MLFLKVHNDGGGTTDYAPAETLVVGCPKCDVQLTRLRGSFPAIDSCGFESYSLACDGCGAALAGIVDPADDALLLTVVED